jgi:secondary thiamine-phosphate synthase enzyme
LKNIVAQFNKNYLYKYIMNFAKNLNNTPLMRQDSFMVSCIQKEFIIGTSGHGDMINITDDVEAIVKNSGITVGTANIFVLGSTAAVGTIEYEQGLLKDLPNLMDRYIPPGNFYGHEQTWHDGNGHSHLQSTLLGTSITVPITDKKLRLGTWQQIFLYEGDIRPRQRIIVVTINGI